MVDLVPAIDNVQDRMEKRTDVAYVSAMQTTIEKYFCIKQMLDAN